MRDSRRRPGRRPAVPAEAETPRLRHELPVAPDPESVHEARLRLRSLLEAGGLRPRVTNAAVDVAHELLLNALQHACPPLRLAVEIGAADVLVEVRDGSTVEAGLRPYRPGVSERGLGLHLVRQLAGDWGQRIDAAGKTVWARIA